MDEMQEIIIIYYIYLFIVLFIVLFILKITADDIDKK